MSQQLRPFWLACWPNMLLNLALGAVLAVGLMVLGIINSWWAFLPFGAFVFLIVLYFYAATTWMIRHQFAWSRSAETMWHLARLNSQSDFIMIDNGLRNTAIELSTNLRKGQVKIIDIYTPQLMPSRTLARLRQTAVEHTILPLSDPRTAWIEGRIDLLPIIDESVRVVVLDQVLSQLDEPRDREILLREIYRILMPGGRLLVTEKVSAGENAWLLGIGGSSGWVSAETWKETLLSERYQLHSEQRISPVLRCFRVNKPAVPPQQLRFDF